MNARSASLASRGAEVHHLRHRLGLDRVLEGASTSPGRGGAWSATARPGPSCRSRATSASTAAVELGGGHRPGSRCRCARRRRPSITSASSASSLALCRPTSRGRSHEPPKSMLRPALHEDRAEAGGVGRDHEVAAEREVEPGARGHAVHLGDGRLRDARAARPRSARRRACARAAGPRSRGIPDSIRSAPAQKARPAPVTTSTRSSRLRATSPNTSLEAAPHLAGDRVHRVGPVERERHHAVATVDEQIRHGPLP